MSRKEEGVWAIIPARGGSKGIPRKNLQDVGGHCLVGRSVAAALAATMVDRVIVSTDDDDIASMAKRYGAEVVKRPDHLALDTSSSESALFHVLETESSLTDGKGAPDIIALIQCTSPFTTPNDIDGTVKLVAGGGADAAFAVVPFWHFLWSPDSEGNAVPINHAGGPRARRQDISPQYLEAGSVYAMKVSKFKEEGHRFCGRTKMFEIEADRCFEIDTPRDLDVARRLIGALSAQDFGVSSRQL